jgi:cob(I)alamin adenosyltransferase
MASKESANTAKPVRHGCVQILTGNGKGKTTAAVGTVVRAVGHGHKVCVVVFMKGDYPYGEWKALAQLPGVKIATFGFQDFTDPNNIKPEEKEQGRQALALARQAVMSGEYDMVVLDEVNIAVSWKIIELDDVVQLVKDKPENVELILTGRYAHAQLIKMADLVTECVKIKHPFDEGILSREGVEY